MLSIIGIIAIICFVGKLIFENIKLKAEISIMKAALVIIAIILLIIIF